MVFPTTGQAWTRILCNSFTSGIIAGIGSLLTGVQAGQGVKTGAVTAILVGVLAFVTEFKSESSDNNNGGANNGVPPAVGGRIIQKKRRNIRNYLFVFA